MMGGRCMCLCRYARRHPREYCQAIKGLVFYVKFRRSCCRTEWLVLAAAGRVLSVLAGRVVAARKTAGQLTALQ
jgi:hypothetical protein